MPIGEVDRYNVRRGIGGRQSRPLAPHADRRRIKRSLPRIPHPKSRWHGPSQTYHASAKLLPDARSLRKCQRERSPHAPEDTTVVFVGLQLVGDDLLIETRRLTPVISSRPLTDPSQNIHQPTNHHAGAARMLWLLFGYLPISAIYPAYVLFHGIDIISLLRSRVPSPTCPAPARGIQRRTPCA